MSKHAQSWYIDRIRFEAAQYWEKLISTDSAKQPPTSSEKTAPPQKVASPPQPEDSPPRA